MTAYLLVFTALAVVTAMIIRIRDMEEEENANDR